MIIILDDHPLARQGLESVIQMNKPDETVIQAGNVREAISYTKENEVSIAFIDLNLGKESGFDFVEWLEEKQYQVKTFLITSSSRKSDFEYAKKLGVDAYVLKDAFVDEIVYGLKVVERGGKFYSATLIDQLNKGSEEEEVLEDFTGRELEVLALLSEGYSNERISKSLFISEGTTKKYITNILGKLNLSNRVEAALYASRNSAIVRAAFHLTQKEDLRKVKRV